MNTVTDKKPLARSVRYVLTLLALAWGVWCVQAFVFRDAGAFSSASPAKKAEAPASTPTEGSELSLTSPASDKSKQKAQRTWIKHADGSLACEDSEGETIEAGRAALVKKGITVFEAKKENDGKMRAAVCGIDTGNHNLFLIPTAQVSKAVKLGYEEVKSAQ